MKSTETKVLSFFNKRLLNKKQNDSNIIINTIDLSKEDTIAIFEEFLIEFNIESGYQSFAIDKYFYDTNIFYVFLCKIFRLNIHNRYPKKKPITINHMIEVAKRKEWFDPS